MAKKNLTIHEIEIRRFMGFQRQEDEFKISRDSISPGINILFGPNGSGKTTAALAIQSLMWPDFSRGSRPTLNGKWQLDEDEWDINIEAGFPRYLCNGTESSRPELAPADWKDRYRLSLHELLRSEDRQLAAQIQNEINGGYDLRAAYDALGFTHVVPSLNIREFREIKNVNRKVEELTREQRDLVKEALELRNLESKKAKVSIAQVRCKSLEIAVSRSEAQQKLEIDKQNFQSFDKCIGNLTGEEGKTFTELKNDLQAKEISRLNKESELADAERREKTTNFPGDPWLPDALVATLESYARKIRQIESEHETREKEFGNKQGAEESLRRKIGENLTENQLQALEFNDLDDLGEWFRMADLYHADDRALETLKKLLQSPDKADDETAVGDLSKGRLLLNEWLRSKEFIGESRNASWIIAVSAAVFMAVLIVLLAFKVHAGFSFLIVLLLPVLFHLLAPHISKGNTGRTRETMVSDYKDLNLDIPQTWEHVQVLKHLECLDQKLADHAIRQEKSDLLRTVIATTGDELTKKKKKIDKVRNRIIDQLPIDLKLADSSYYLLIENIRKWQSEHRILLEEKVALENSNERLTAELKAFNEQQHQYTGRTAENSHDIEGIVEELGRRVDEFNDARSVINHAKTEIKRLSIDIDEFKDKERAILRKIDREIDTDNTEDLIDHEHALIDLSGQRESYLTAQQEFESSKKRLDEIDQKIREDSEFDQDFLDLPKEALIEKLDHAKSQFEGLESIITNITELTTRINEAKKKHELEKALSEKAKSEFELQQVWSKFSAASAGHALASFLSRRSQNNASRVLARARTSFSEITRHRFELVVADGNDPEFRARDRVTGELRSVNELSSATRIQLFLAVRIAFIEEHEGNGPCLPLILDEVLANSDDDRAEAIINAIIAIAAKGRQVFYFTAQSDEVGKWIEILGKQKNVDYQVPIFLPPASPAMEFFPSTIATIALDEISEPHNLTREEYGKTLKVPPLNPLRQMGEAHLWYFIDDSETLYRLLKMGYVNWGQLEYLVQDTGVEALVQLGISNDSDFYPRCHALMVVYEEGIKLWKIGRGTLIDRRILDESGAVSEKFINEIVGIAKGAHGNAETVIQNLKDKAVKGFLSKKIEELENYLIVHGYIDERPPLSADEFKIKLDGVASAYIESGKLSYPQLDQIRSWILLFNPENSGLNI